MNGTLWKTLEKVDAKQVSLLSAIAYGSFVAAVMLSVGMYKGEAKAAAAKASDKEVVTALKPEIGGADKYGRMHVDTATGARHPDWELRKVIDQILSLYPMMREPERNTSPAQLIAIDEEVRAFVSRAEELRDSLEAKTIIGHDALIGESKDASSISKDVGDSR